MPSIMPLGATMSAPARAWTTACWASSSQRGVVVDVDAGRSARSSAPQWPWSVYSQKQTSVMTSKSAAACLAARMAWAMMPESLVASLPAASFCAGMPKRITPPRPSSAAWLISSASMSGESWNWPGMEAIGCAHVLARPDEQRQDQIGRREPRLADQFADRRMVAKPSQAGGGKPGTEAKKSSDMAGPIGREGWWPKTLM